MGATKEEILHHVGYEWWMFRAAASLLDTMDPASDPVRNALLESMIVHGRGLIYFFCEKERYDADWTYEDVDLSKSTQPPVLKEWREEANRRIAHLTENRATTLASWKVAEVRTELEKLIGKLQSHPDLPSPWIGNKTDLSSNLLVKPKPGAPSGHAGQPTSPAPPQGPVRPLPPKT